MAKIRVPVVFQQHFLKASYNIFSSVKVEKKWFLLVRAFNRTSQRVLGKGLFQGKCLTNVSCQCHKLSNTICVLMIRKGISLQFSNQKE